MKKNLAISGLLLGVIVIFGWLQSPLVKSNEEASSKNVPTADSKTFRIQGTVVHKTLEGGFFTIESDDGNIYDPINLPEHFKKQGLKVKVNAKLRNDVGGVHMVGDIIEIIDIDAE